MDANSMLGLVSRYQDNRDFIANEETAKVALVIPFIRLLGYDPSNPREVRLEYSAEFTQADGKRFPDRMDFAIFDKAGTKPLMVIETKPLGTDLASKANQLARYIAQMPDLRFGIITDGCHYLFFGDLDRQNQMDREPFFRFALDEPKTDWSKVAKFLTKFSRGAFNAETLVTDAENARYRQAMSERLAEALRSPKDDDGFVRWLSEGIYKGHRTKNAMERLGEIAKECVEPAVMQIIGDDFLNSLRKRIHTAKESTEESAVAEPIEESPKLERPSKREEPQADEATARRGSSVVTTEEELAFYELVRNICERSGADPEKVLYRDTVNYFNVSYERPTKWFLRFFGDSRRKSVVTLVPPEEAADLAHGFEVEAAPATFGVSRIYIEDIAQVWGLTGVVARSLAILRSGRQADAPAADDVAETG